MQRLTNRRNKKTKGLTVPIEKYQIYFLYRPNVSSESRVGQSPFGIFINCLQLKNAIVYYSAVNCAKQIVDIKCSIFFFFITMAKSHRLFFNGDINIRMTTPGVKKKKKIKRKRKFSNNR